MPCPSSETARSCWRGAFPASNGQDSRTISACTRTSAPRRSARRAVWAARNTRSTACRTRGPSRRVGYLPYTDTVAEIKVETAGFDASKGHTSGATISMLTKSGTNRVPRQRHLAVLESGLERHAEHDQRRLLRPHRAGDRRRPNRRRRAIRERAEGSAGQPQQLRRRARRPGQLPGIFNGTNKLFFFFSYNGFKDVKVEEATAVNRTVPTEAQRRGDFSDLLRIDPVRYQIYDPRTARLVNGRVVRDPFPNNQVPILNPIYQHYVNLYPLAQQPARHRRLRRPQQLSGVRDAVQLGLQRLQQPLRLEHLGSASHLRALELEQVRRRPRRLDVRDGARPAHQRPRAQERRARRSITCSCRAARPSGTCRWPTTASSKATR